MPASPGLTVAQPSGEPGTMLEVLRPVDEQVQVRPSVPSVAQFTPPDVVVEIFKLLATRLEVRSSGRTHQFPWYLGQICSSWRSAFLSMHSEFWSQFCLSPDPSVRREAHFTQEMQIRCIDIARLFLERGRGNPISFEIRKGAPSSPLLDIFIEESERWLDVECVMYVPKIRSLSAIKNRTPLLRTLSLFPIGLNYNKWNAASGCQDLFKNAPRLTHVRVHVLSKWVFNWSSLAVFELTSMNAPPDTLFHVLSEMKNLERLVLDLQYYYRVHTDRTITLPCLKVLATVGYMNQWLFVIEAPNLQELYWEVPYDSFGECTRFLDRSSYRLKRLGIKTSEGWIMDHLVQLTREVDFLNVVVPADIRRCQLYPLLENHHDQLPELRELNVYYLDDSEQELTNLTWLSNIIRSWTSTTCQQFRSLILTFPPKVDPSAPQLRAMRALCIEGGIELRVECFAPGTDWAASLVHGKSIQKIEYWSYHSYQPYRPYLPIVAVFNDETDYTLPPDWDGD